MHRPPCLFVLLLFLISLHAPAQEAWWEQAKRPEHKRRFRVMWWNVENLYDTLPDPHSDDREFLPESPRQWNTYRYWKKQGDLAKVILAGGGIQPIDVIGLSEVENDSVIHHLCRRTRLARLGYKYVVTQSPDLRGIDVALLYQPESFALFSHSTHSIVPDSVGHRPTRDLLLASGRIVGGDTLDIILAHLPSRRDGKSATEPYRLHVARRIVQLTDSLSRHRSHLRLILMGDLNDEPQDPSIARVLKTRLSLLSADARPRHSTSPADIEGTYFFQRRWSRIDHILVSPALLRPSQSLITSAAHCHLLALPYLLEGIPPRQRPRRLYLGTRYHGGVSDHLPLMLDFWY